MPTNQPGIDQDDNTMTPHAEFLSSDVFQGYVLFGSWLADSPGKYAGTIIAVVLLGFLYQVLREKREVLIKKVANRSTQKERITDSLREQLVVNSEVISPSSPSPPSLSPLPRHDDSAQILMGKVKHDDLGMKALGYEANENESQCITVNVKQFSNQLCSLATFVDIFTHALQTMLGYMLMLIVMSYNLGLFFATVLGITLGHLWCISVTLNAHSPSLSSPT
eukprot:m.99372 g.99372  ORF g.99372 m.99372 type:complete len:222 (+) comp27151_c0_seq1:163-828(+)